MKNPSPQNRTLLSPEQRRVLRRRKQIVAAVMIATFLLLFLYNLGSWLFLKEMGRELEQSLDQRLLATARLTTALIERSVADFSDAQDAGLLRLSLNRIRLGNDLEAVYLVDAEGRLFLDARHDLQSRIERRYLREDSTVIRTAWRGDAQVSRLHRVVDDHFKNAYAPVNDLYGATLLLVLEANADFLHVMDKFHRGLYLGVLITFLLLGVLGVFLALATAQFVRTETRLFQTQRLAWLGQMSATVAHELRNPLAIIKSTTDVLREKYVPRDRPEEFFDYIDDEIHRLNTLVNDFLAFSREPVLRLAHHDLVDLLRTLLQAFTADGVRMEWVCALQTLLLRCDADKLQQVFLNLLVNAQQALAGREGVITVTLQRERSRGQERAWITFHDTGPGLMGQGNEIFEPFFTTKSSGTGLGLAVSRQIIESHGGTIAASEPPGGGTLLTIYLPLTAG